ncbi:MAG TPA: hypothetical protein VJ986_01875 [Gaiellaceae bacterium]|nr:hypothetical protein [Gaiellaceae bacterium]
MAKLAAAGATVALLASVGAAVASAQGGPPAGAPRLGLQQENGAAVAGAYGIRAGGVVMDAAAAYIGIDESALAVARHDGSSLAQIAIDNGKTVVGLEAALVDAFKVNLDSLVSAGRITQAQADQMLAGFKANVSTVVTRTATGPANGRGFGRGMGGGPGLGLGQCPNA